MDERAKTEDALEKDPGGQSFQKDAWWWRKLGEKGDITYCFQTKGDERREQQKRDERCYERQEQGVRSAGKAGKIFGKEIGHLVLQRAD